MAEREWVSVEFAGPDTRIETSLCSHCPRGPAGCCAEPPPYSLPEIGRVAAAPGGLQWLAAQVAGGRLQVRDEVLQPARRDGACTYWQAGHGCSLPEQFRPAQCNFFICGEALQLANLTPGTGAADGGLDPVRKAHTGLLRLYDRWHRTLLASLGRMGLAPLDPDAVPRVAGALAHWWRGTRDKWEQVEPTLPAAGRFVHGQSQSGDDRP